MVDTHQSMLILNVLDCLHTEQMEGRTAFMLRLSEIPNFSFLGYSQIY